MKTNFSLMLSCILLFTGLTSTNALTTTPTIQAKSIVITNLTSSSAKVSWTNGNGTKRLVFAEYPSQQAAGPYDNTTYTASSNWNIKGSRLGTSNYYCVYNGSGNSVTLTNLPPSARFTIRIFEYNGSPGDEKYLGTIVSGNPKVFYTLPAPVTPTVQAKSIVITNLTSSSAKVSWTNGNGAKRLVFAEYPSLKAAGPYDNTTYTASSNWNIKGSRLGTSNYYCVYNGSGNSVTLTNLPPSARFTIRIFEYNGSPGDEKYLGTIVSGNPKVFYTLPAPVTPTVQAKSIVITNLTSSSAKVSWTNGNGAKRLVFAEYPSQQAAGPYDNTTYTASSNWNIKGSRLGTSNYYCVYNGSGNSVTLTNLPPSARFTIRIFEYNGSPGDEKYLGTIVSGNPKVFYTSSQLKSTTEITEINTSIYVYPNQTSDLVFIESIKESEGIMYISVSGLNGQQIYETSTHQNNLSIDLTNETAGIYIINVRSDEVTKTFKVIKK